MNEPIASRAIADLAAVECPGCGFVGGVGLTLAPVARLVALAGAQPKLGVRLTPTLECQCGWHEIGKQMDRWTEAPSWLRPPPPTSDWYAP